MDHISLLSKAINSVRISQLHDVQNGKVHPYMVRTKSSFGNKIRHIRTSSIPETDLQVFGPKKNSSIGNITSSHMNSPNTRLNSPAMMNSMTNLESLPKNISPKFTRLQSQILINKNQQGDESNQNLIRNDTSGNILENKS